MRPTLANRKLETSYTSGFIACSLLHRRSDMPPSCLALGVVELLEITRSVLPRIFGRRWKTISAGRSPTSSLPSQIGRRRGSFLGLSVMCFVEASIARVHVHIDGIRPEPLTDDEVLKLHAVVCPVAWVLAPLRRGSRPAPGLGSLPNRRLARNAFRELLPTRFTIPFLERLVRDLSFDEKLSKFTSLCLALERHSASDGDKIVSPRLPRAHEGAIAAA